MKLAIFMLLFVLYARCTVEDVPEINHSALFLKGFLKGGMNKDGSEIDKWVIDADRIITSVQTLVDNFKKSLSPVNMVTEACDVMTNVRNWLVTVKEIKHSVEGTFQNWMGKARNTGEMSRIGVNAMTLYKKRLDNDINVFKNSFIEKHFEESGRAFGDIPHVVFDLWSDPYQKPDNPEYEGPGGVPIQ